MLSHATVFSVEFRLWKKLVTELFICPGIILKQEGLEAAKIRRLSGLLSVMLRNRPIQMVSDAGNAR